MPRSPSCARTIRSRCAAKSSRSGFKSNPSPQRTQRKTGQIKPRFCIPRCSLYKASLACVPKSCGTKQQRRPDCNLRNDESVGPDDSANISCRGRIGPCFLLLRRNHVEILVCRSRVEEHDFIVRAKKSTGTQFPISNQRRRSSGSGEHAFHTSPVSSGCQNFFVGRSHRSTSAFFQDVENQVVPIRLWNTQASRKCLCAAPHFADPFSGGALGSGNAVCLPGFHNRRATRGLHSNHFGALGADPAELLHLIEGLPHTDHPHAATGRIDDALRKLPVHLFGNLIAHRLLAFDAERLFEG